MKNIPIKKVYDFWNKSSCGEKLYLFSTDCQGYLAQSSERYRLEPFILPFADFDTAKGKKVLEIGVGLGSDHQMFAKAGCILYGIDLTERAIEHTKRRLNLFGLTSRLNVGDAEKLIFSDNEFDLVYSWGVLHHSPNTRKAIDEVYRVLRPGGVAKIMIYHKWSLVGIMLWLRYSVLTGKLWLGLNEIYATHLESPGTKAFSVREAKDLFIKFKHIQISTPLSHADLLASNVGQNHRGQLLRFAKIIWPRNLFKWLFPDAGLMMMIKAEK